MYLTMHFFSSLDKVINKTTSDIPCVPNKCSDELCVHVRLQQTDVGQVKTYLTMHFFSLSWWSNNKMRSDIPCAPNKCSDEQSVCMFIFDEQMWAGSKWTWLRISLVSLDEVINKTRSDVPCVPSKCSDEHSVCMFVFDKQTQASWEQQNGNVMHKTACAPVSLCSSKWTWVGTYPTINFFSLYWPSNKESEIWCTLSAKQM